MKLLNQRRIGLAPGDRLSKEIGDEPPAVAVHPLDSPEMLREHKQLLEWWYHERDLQAENRLQQAIDADFYDNKQWDDEDAMDVESRGQMPLVYNEVGPMVDWLIGTERRTKADWTVMPRTQEDVALADIKRKTLKYVSDVNMSPFARSRAFSDAVKSGLGWIDDGIQDDPTKDVLYSKYEDWRRVLHDSLNSYELDLSDARFVFRWRWVDEDVALAMFPGREDLIRKSVERLGVYRNGDEDEEEPWYLGQKVLDSGSVSVVRSSGVGTLVEARRRRVKLIEAQYRKPVSVRVVRDPRFRGDIMTEQDLADPYSGTLETAARMMMRVHMCVFTELGVLAWSQSPFRHNEFTLTPIWCYRRGRDRLPYGMIRRVRDVQKDLNKRASKALFLLNSNQVIVEEGGVEDLETLREEVDRPDGMIVKRPGRELEIRRDAQAANGQIEMMTLAAQSIQKSAGVNNENLGRATNAVSGAAIEARQNQGAVGTTEPFDNLRYAIQIQGAKVLSHVEQFYSETKVIPIVGAKNKIDWVSINHPEVQPDGTIRWLNDITSSKSRFVVSDQDYSGTLRQLMVNSISTLASKLPPDAALRLYAIAMEYSDLPNADEIVSAIREVTGGQSEEDKQQLIQQQQEQAMLAMAEARAKVRELNARAAKLEADAARSSQDVREEIATIRAQAADQIDRLSEELRTAQTQLVNKLHQVVIEANTKERVAEIAAEGQVEVARVKAQNEKDIEKLHSELERAFAADHQGETDGNQNEQ